MEDSFRILVEQLQDGVYFTDKHRVITYWNPAAERITGFSRDEVVGRGCYADILKHVNQDGVNMCKSLCPLAMSIRDGDSREAEVFLHHKNGHMVPVWVRTAQVRDENGEVTGATEVFTDLSPKQAAIQRVKELEELALVDPLTRISNRRHLEEQYGIMSAERDRIGIGIGLVLIDLDHFKQLNDMFGHLQGDEVLKRVAETLTMALRSFDLVGRWGGEEFLCLCRDVNQDSLSKITEKLRMLIENMTVRTPDGVQIPITVSIGATLSQKYEYWKSAFQRADSLLYRSKANGRNQVSLG